MSIEDRWLLPDGVEDVLPPQAKQLEAMRRLLLDLFESWGYEYVIPPMVEFLESLLTGTGKDLDLQTFKVVDLVTGRTMGVRADITPQVARIDAHSLNGNGIARLCYAGTVVKTKADTQLANRTPLSVGAELFGETSSKGDIEIVSLMAESFNAMGFETIHVDLGDVSIFKQLVASLALTDDQQGLLFAAVQKKSVAEIGELTRRFELSENDQSILCALPGLTGDATVLDKARDLFGDNLGILDCLDNLETIYREITRRFVNLNVYFDLSELRGYAYHTGIVFAAYVDGAKQVVAQGGRYDHIGGVFGRDGRSATGFSVNLKSLIDLTLVAEADKRSVVVVDDTANGSDSLWSAIQRLRSEGYIVVESGDQTEFDHKLINQDGEWRLISS